MSYKTRQRKRQRRRHLKIDQAANADIDRLVRTRAGPHEISAAVVSRGEVDDERPRTAPPEPPT